MIADPAQQAGGGRRVLVVHYHFLPVHNVAVKRLVAYARQLPAFGWQPVVLTRAWTGLDDADPSWGLSWEPEIEEGVGFPIHRVPVPSPGRHEVAWQGSPWPIRKAMSLAHLTFGAYPDEFVPWVRPAVRAVSELARRTALDAVLTYCPPESNHVVGHRIARALGLPWIPFFGDLWGFLLPDRATRPGAIIRRAYHRRWLAPAAACAAVSPYMAAYLTRTYGKRVELVLTGFDPQEFTGPVPRREPDRFVVSHVGSLYPGDQKPAIFFDGLDRLLRAHPEVEGQLRVRFVGSKCDRVLHALVQDRPSGRVCRIEPKVPSREAVALVRTSDALLAFTCSAHRRRHGTMSYPTKIFEAFGARRPVLAIPADRDWVDALLARTGGGVSARDAGEVATVLWEWFSAWRRHATLPYQGRSEALEEFTLHRQVSRLAALLDNVVNRRHAREVAV
jgi:glycosyltransferase involved in cell wall biosynthesis